MSRCRSRPARSWRSRHGWSRAGSPRRGLALPAGGSPRSHPGYARRRPAADRDRPADFCRARGAVARRRPGARRPRQARGGARAGGVFRHVRAAARLYPSAALSAVRRAGAGHRRGAGGDRPRHRAARARAGLVAAARASTLLAIAGVWAAGAVAGPRAGAGPRGEAPAAPRSDRRAVRRRGEARAVRDPARLRDYRAGRTRGAASPPRAARRGGRAATTAASARSIGAAAIGRAGAAADVPLVLVQCELFFDARRASPSIPQTCCRDSMPVWTRAPPSDGSMSPGWGANTMRAEFAVLTGITDQDLGYDRFNPYHAFARAPIASLAWRLRAEGYRTLCLHPFDRGFFHRDLAMPALGFDEFLGRESLGGSRRPPYFADPELARRVSGDPRRGRPAHLYFRHHYGQSRPLARIRSADRSCAAAALRSARHTPGRPIAALSRRPDPVGRDAGDFVGGARSRAGAMAFSAFTATTCRACRTPLSISASTSGRATMSCSTAP